MPMRTVFGNRETREKKSLANREYYSTLLENKPEATFLADAGGELYLMNGKARTLTGYTEEEIREYHVRDLFITFRNIDNPFDSTPFAEFSAQMYLLDARRYMIPVMLDFREIEGNKFLCTCLESFDLTESRPAPKEVSGNPFPEVPVMSALHTTHETHTRLSVEFEHEIRSVLNNILGFTSTLSANPKISEDKRLSGLVESMLRSGNHLKEIFNQVSLGDPGSHEINRTPVSVSPLLQKTAILLESIARRYNMPIRIMPHTDVMVVTDESLLLELLKFLLGKALIYSRNESVVVEVSSDGSDGKVVIQIDNLGQDIPQGIIQFIQRENSRDYYDLSDPVINQNPEIINMLQILNRIEAKISFFTAQSMGEIARIILPKASGTDHVDDIAILEQSVRRKDLHVLVIEDEKFSAQILQIFLEGIARVSIAYSGNEALNITEIHYKKGTIFSAVIMDIGLPKPWDGILLKREMEKRWPEYKHIPFLAETAFASKGHTDRIMENRFSGHLIKPVTRANILMFLDKSCS